MCSRDVCARGGDADVEKGRCLREGELDEKESRGFCQVKMGSNPENNEQGDEKDREVHETVTRSKITSHSPLCIHVPMLCDFSLLLDSYGKLCHQTFLANEVLAIVHKQRLERK